MAKGRILVVDDDKAIRGTFDQVLKREGYSVQLAGGGTETLKKIRDSRFDLVICDVRMPGMNGLEVLKKIKSIKPEVDVIMITAYATIEDGVKAIKDGAHDYLIKPLDIEELCHKVAKVMEKRNLERKVTSLQEELKERYGFSNIIGTTPQMQQLYEMIDKMRNADCNVLIEGESGTGKELVARAIHYNGRLAKKPFVGVGCGALPESIVERELFGHEKGAFTDATSTRPGYFEAADGGTLFLDDITDLTLSIQAKLLRVVEENQFFRLGSTNPVKVKVRQLSATNKDARSCVEKGTFREDLFYRLSVVCIKVPPLRARRDDIPLLVKHFFEKFSDKYGKEPQSLDPKAEAVLLSYQWPGNVRELEHVIERAVALTSEKIIQLSDLPENMVSPSGRTRLPGSFDREASYSEAKRQLMESFDKDFIAYHLKKAEGNVSKAAKQMGIQRTSLQRLMKKHLLHATEFKPSP